MKEYRLGIYEKAMPSTLNWEEKFITAKNAGFDFVEISIDETDGRLERLNMSEKERSEMCCLMKKTGIYIESMCLSGHRRFPIGSENDEVREKGMDIMRKAIIFARDIGIRIVQIAGYDVYYEKQTPKTQEYFAQNLQRSVNFAAQYAVTLSFETMETEFLDNVSKAMKWVDKIKSPYLTIYPDTGNITNAACLYSTNVIDDIKVGEGYISALHLKETKPGKYREIPYGQGHVNFKEIIKIAYEMGVRKYLAEFWYVGQANWKEDIKDANMFLRSFFNDFK